MAVKPLSASPPDNDLTDRPPPDAIIIQVHYMHRKRGSFADRDRDRALLEVISFHYNAHTGCRDKLFI